MADSGLVLHMKEHLRWLVDLNRSWFLSKSHQWFSRDLIASDISCALVKTFPLLMPVPTWCPNWWQIHGLDEHSRVSKLSWQESADLAKLRIHTSLFSWESISLNLGGTCAKLLRLGLQIQEIESGLFISAGSFLLDSFSLTRFEGNQNRFYLETQLTLMPFIDSIFLSLNNAEES